MMTYDQQETRRMLREFAQLVDLAGEMAAALDAHVDDPDDRHGLTDEQVRVVQRAVNEVLELCETTYQRDMRCLVNDIEN